MADGNGGRPTEDAPHLKGDGWDDVDLMTAQQVADLLEVSRDHVYTLPIPCIKISPRNTRWRRRKVLEWLAEREG